MKKAYITLSLLALILIAGCGGPNYANGFKEWLGNNVAKTGPLKLVWVKIEKLSSGKTQAVFKFTSEVQITENQYGPVGSDDVAPAKAALQKMREANVSIPRQNEITALFNAMITMRLPVYKIVTPKGKNISMSGRAQATLQNNGEWSYELLEVVGGNYPAGKEPTGQWALDGSKEAKENAVAVQEQVEAVVAAADKAIQEARDAQIAEQKKQAEEQEKLAEEQRRQEEAKKALREEMLALCAPGSELLGRWQGARAGGDVGIRFGAQTAIGNTVAVTGVLFDPAKTQYQKPFDGKIQQTDDPNAPFALRLSIQADRGGVKYDGRWDDPQVKNKTVGLLLEKCDYTINLTITAKGLFGIAGHTFGMGATDGDVEFSFNKGYTPIGKAEDSGGTSDLSKNAPSASTLSADKVLQNSVGQLEMVVQMLDAGNKNRANEVINTISEKAAPLNTAILAATNAGDNAKAQILLAEMNRDFPAAKQTLVWGFVQAVARKDRVAATSYWQIIEKYPFEQKDRDQLNSLYENLP